MAVELPQDYYLDNYHKLIGFVYSQYQDLLTEAEKAFYVDFHQKLSLEAQRLYVRLISRKGRYFRSDKLHYKEITSIAASAQALAEAGFATLNPPIELEILLRLLSRTELIALEPEAPAGFASRKKSELVNHFLLNHEEQAVRLRIAQQFFLLTPLRLEELLIYRLCFFGNLRQDLSEFVLLDLGIIRYEDYEILQDDRYFHSRELLEKTLRLMLTRDQLDGTLASVDAKTLMDHFTILPQHHNDLYLKRLHNRLTNTLARQLERLNALGQALMLYEQSELPPARERRARILAKLGRTQSALALCEEILETPGGEEEGEFAISFAARLRKKLGLSVAKVADLRVTTEEVVLPQGSGQRIELQAVDYFRAQGDQAFYVENHLMVGLFGLAFWDIVFMPLRGAFFNLYQRGPKGLFSAEFRLQRRQSIDERLILIAQYHRWPAMVLATYRKKYGISNDLVHWPALPEELLRLALERIPRAHLVKIFTCLSYDLGTNKAGFPDLVVFAQRPGYELVEVKAPGDRLQPNQKRWIKRFNEFDIPYRVMRVRFA